MHNRSMKTLIAGLLASALLPGFVLEPIGADRASLTLSGRELDLLWRKDDYMWNSRMVGDPETTDTNRAPPPLTRWSVELNVTF